MAKFDINDIPAMAPPRGQTSNFENPETLHPVVLGVAIATITLMVMAVAVRVYTKGVIMRDMKVEECQFARLKGCTQHNEPFLTANRFRYCSNCRHHPLGRHLHTRIVQWLYSASMGRSSRELRASRLRKSCNP